MSKSTISTFELFQMFPDQESARLYLEFRLWPDGVTCPTCRKGERITTRKGGYYRCNACNLDFTVRTGTIFERSHIPLHKWLAALYLFTTESKITFAKISDACEVTMKTAGLILSRIREAVPDDLSVDYIGIEGFPSYRVGSDGSVWSCARGKQWHPLKPTPDKDGYNMVRLYAPDGWKQARVAVLICTAFHGPCPLGQEVRHLDGTRNNDAVDNLCWGTSVENKADQIRHGTKLSGDRHHNTILSESAIDQIRLLKGQRKQREVAAQFGTTQSYVSEIWSGRRRKAASTGKRLTYKELTA